jgi:signal transduction histidine kinase
MSGSNISAYFASVTAPLTRFMEMCAGSVPLLHDLSPRTYLAISFAISILGLFALNVGWVVDVMFYLACVPTWIGLGLATMAMIVATAAMFLRDVHKKNKSGYPILHLRWLLVYPLIVAGFVLLLVFSRGKTYGCLITQLTAAIGVNCALGYITYGLYFYTTRFHAPDENNAQSVLPGSRPRDSQGPKDSDTEYTYP